MSKERVNMYTEAFNNGNIRQRMASSNLERMRMVVGTYIVCLPGDIDAHVLIVSCGTSRAAGMYRWYTSAACAVT